MGLDGPDGVARATRERREVDPDSALWRDDHGLAGAAPHGAGPTVGHGERAAAVIRDEVAVVARFAVVDGAVTADSAGRRRTAPAAAVATLAGGESSPLQARLDGRVEDVPLSEEAESRRR